MDQQLVIYRLAPDAEEHVSRPVTFDAAGTEWRRQQALLQDGGYVVWWNEDMVWRQSTKRDGTHDILGDEEARAIVDRVLLAPGGREGGEG